MHDELDNFNNRMIDLCDKFDLESNPVAQILNRDLSLANEGNNLSDILERPIISQASPSDFESKGGPTVIVIIMNIHQNTTSVSSSRTGSGVAIRSTEAPSMMTTSPTTTKRAVLDWTRPIREHNSPPVGVTSKQPMRSNNDNYQQSAPTVPTSTKSGVADTILMKTNSELLVKNDELEQAIIDIKKENCFYFKKLRKTEVILQDNTLSIDDVFIVL